MPSFRGSCQQRDQTCVCCPTFEEPGEKQVLHIPPPHNTSSGVGKALKSPLGLTSGHTPTFTPRKEPAHPSQGARKEGNLLLVLTAPCFSRGLSKDLPEFLVWLIVSIYWLRRPRALVSSILGQPQSLCLAVWNVFSDSPLWLQGQLCRN